jgi:PAS domain S-box-containing protein
MLRLKNRLNHLLTSAPAVTYCFEAKGDYLPTFVSENIRDLLGYEPEDYLNDRNFVPSHIHPDDAQRAQDDLSRLFSEGYLVHEYRFLCKDGHYCWVNDELHVLTDDYGEPLEVVGSWSDITVRRKLGEAMVAAQDRLNHLLTSAPAVLYSFEPGGDYLPTFISENVKLLLGYEPKEFLKDADFWTERIHPNDLPRAQENHKKLYKEGELTHEYRFLHKEGHYCWVNEELHLLHNSEGEATEVVGSMNDISERKEAEDNLAIAKEQAEQANRAKSDFLANMSHELRTPLNAIIGITEMLSEDIKDDIKDIDINEFDESLSRVHGAGKHLLDMINELLDISKIEAGKIDLHIETFRITDLMKDVAATIKPMIDTNHNTLEVKNMTDQEDIRSDKKRVMQILLNLLSNAAKFTENGSVTLEVRFSNEDNSEYLYFDVIDTGRGIPEEKSDDVFSEYVQIESSNTSKFAGTGLGLNISRKLARIMEGDITFKSKYGQGTVFTLQLPVKVSVE